ncbi:hypothetical protein M0R45_006299 [Rubus argutus]|uniref:RING-type domain-containing protein n=1 Tax=Rubus argutus TaxID=59490 RepID=A0AAW1YQJ5_RUBAR
MQLVKDDDEMTGKQKRNKNKRRRELVTPGVNFIDLCYDDDDDDDDDFRVLRSFGIQNCTHSYCEDCINNYVASKLQENINVTSIKCPVPDCKGSLDCEYCRPILPPEVFEKWGSALCEAIIVGSQRFYCPFKDCSALLIADGTEEVVSRDGATCGP